MLTVTLGGTLIDRFGALGLRGIFDLWCSCGEEAAVRRSASSYGRRLMLKKSRSEFDCAFTHALRVRGTDAASVLTVVFHLLRYARSVAIEHIVSVLVTRLEAPHPTTSYINQPQTWITSDHPSLNHSTQQALLHRTYKGKKTCKRPRQNQLAPANIPRTALSATISSPHCSVYLARPGTRSARSSRYRPTETAPSRSKPSPLPRLTIDSMDPLARTSEPGRVCSYSLPAPPALKPVQNTLFCQDHEC